MNTIYALVISLFAFTAIQAEEKKMPSTPAKADSLEGEWKVISSVRYGKPLPAKKAAKLVFKFTGEKAAIGPEGQRQETSTFTIDATKSPKEITFSNKHESEEAKGIYKFENGKLIMCWSKPGKARPKTFESKKEDRSVLFILQKK